MFSLKKRHVVIGGILAGFAVAYQDQIQSVWTRFERLTARSDASIGPSDAVQSHSNVSMSANSSLGMATPIEPNTAAVHRDPIHSRTVSTGPNLSTRNGSSEASVIRIASFNMHAFGESKLKRLAVAETMIRIFRQFDVIALQHIQSRQQYVLPELVERLNQSDRRYEYCIGPRVGSEANQQQFAFVFDTDRIETDRQMLYTVDDPQRLMEYEPLVGWFRAKTVSSERAFTFSLVNLRVAPLNNEREWKLLPDLIRSVRQDGRHEDDVILAGDFGASSRELASLQNTGMIFGLEDIPTTITGEAMLDNIVFPARATDEFTGKSGVVDFLRQGNLSIDQALQVSSHMPVWAEFYAKEGGRTSL
jgi:deoxyribonuclease-1-like protein